MRHAYRARLLHEHSNLLPMRPRGATPHDDDQLTAFRGFLLAAGASTVLWGLCLMALWLVFWRK
jgi:hypothetical protein